MPPDQALLHDNRALAASAGFPIRPSLVEQATVQEVEEPQPDLTISPASETWQAHGDDESYVLENKTGAARSAPSPSGRVGPAVLLGKL